MRVKTDTECERVGGKVKPEIPKGHTSLIERSTQGVYRHVAVHEQRYELVGWAKKSDINCSLANFNPHYIMLGRPPPPVRCRLVEQPSHSHPSQRQASLQMKGRMGSPVVGGTSLQARRAAAVGATASASRAGVGGKVDAKVATRQVRDPHCRCSSPPSPPAHHFPHPRTHFTPPPHTPPPTCSPFT